MKILYDYMTVATHSFLAGLRKNTCKPMLFGIMTAVLLLGGLEYVFRSGFYTVLPEDYLSASPHRDYSLHTSYRIGALKRQPPHSPAVYIFGSSTGRAGFTERVLSEYLTNMTGQSIACYNLSLHSGALTRDWAILDNLPSPQDESYVILSIGPRRFSQTLDYKPAKGNEVFITQAQHVTDIRRKIYYSFVLPPVAHKFLLYLKNNIRTLLKGRLPQKTPENYFFGVADAQEGEIYINIYAKNVIPQYKKNETGNLFLFAEFIDAIIDRGFKVIVVNMPLNNEYLKGRWDNSLLSYIPKVRDICSSKGSIFLNYQETLPLKGNHFADIQHMNAAGREIFNMRFAEDLALIMRNTAERPQW